MVDVDTRDGRRVLAVRPPAKPTEEMLEFARVLWRALRMICSYLEKRYGFGHNTTT